MSESPNDLKIAYEWIQTIENPSATVRNTDIYPRLADWIQRTNPTQILEVGCGQGACSHHVLTENLNYTGIDASPTLIDRARTLYADSKKSFIVGNVETLPFRDQIFDAVYSVAVLHLVADLSKAIQEVSRVLRADGAFMIICPNPQAYSLWTKSYTNTRQNEKMFTGDQKCSDGSLVTETLFLHSMDDILRSLKNSGLLLENKETFRHIDNQDLFLIIEGRKLSE